MDVIVTCPECHKIIPIIVNINDDIILITEKCLRCGKTFVLLVKIEVTSIRLIDIGE